MSYEGNLERIATALERLAGKGEPEEDAPAAQESPTVFFGRAKMLDGRHVHISRVYLGTQIPGLDHRGNYVEQYTTLYRIDEGEWFSSSIARSVTDREGVLARFESEGCALRKRGLDPQTISWTWRE